MRTEIHYHWRYYDAIRRRTVTTTYTCSRESIEREHPDAVPIEGSCVERHIPETPEEIAERMRSLSLSHLQNR